MFRFTIRDVLWMMVVVGLGVGWFADHRKLSASVSSWMQGAAFVTQFLYYAKERRWAVQWLENGTVSIETDEEYDDKKRRNQLDSPVKVVIGPENY